MTDRTPDVQELESAALDAKIRMRALLADTYAAVKSSARAATLALPNVGKMLQERYVDLVGPSPDPRRPARLEQVKALRAQFRDALAQIRSLPPEHWALTSPAEDATASATVESEEPD